MARTGKIARLPREIREELNARLRDNESGQTLLEWVNSLEATQDVLKRHFGSEPISDANLSIWRQGGFAEWMTEQEQVHRIEKLSELSLRLARASGGNLSEGMLAIAAGKLQEAMEAGQDVEIGEDGEPVVTGPCLDKLVKALTAVRGMELEKQKLDLKKIEVTQKGESLDLERAKFRRATAELFIDYCEDERAKHIALGAGTKDNKVAQLIQLWFGEMPENIGPAEFRKPKEAAKPS